jgi:hypothetical protein
VSYSNNFTTLLRTTRQPGLQNLVSDRDTLGGDPLPAWIGKASVIFEVTANNGVAGFTTAMTNSDSKQEKTSMDATNDLEPQATLRNELVTFSHHNDHRLLAADNAALSPATHEEHADDSGPLLLDYSSPVSPREDLPITQHMQPALAASSSGQDEARFSIPRKPLVTSDP